MTPIKNPMTYASREDIEVDLSIIEGQIPNDMHGFVYFNSMCGTVNSTTPIPEKMPDGSRNSEYGEMIFNGDGMILRFSLDTPGKVSVKTKLMKPPCYFADEATKFGTEYYKNGLLVKFINRDNEVTDYTYNESGHIISEKKKDFIRTFKYGNNGLPIEYLGFANDSDYNKEFYEFHD